MCYAISFCVLSPLVPWNAVERNDYKMDQTRIYYDLTTPQKRIWHTQQIYPNSPIYIIGGKVHIFGSINVDLLIRAICMLINQHDSFGIRIEDNECGIKQYFIHPNQEILPYYDFSFDSNSANRLQDQIDKFYNISLPKEGGTLFDVFVYKISAVDFGYVFKLHHVISDGWSAQLISHYVKRYYESISNDQVILNERNMQYKEFIDGENRYLYSSKYYMDKIYWEKQLSKLPVSPKKFPEILTSNRKTHYLSKEFSCRIKEFARKNNFSLETLFIAAFFLSKMHTIGETNIIIGVPYMNRYGHNERSIIGDFSVVLPFYFTADKDESVLIFLNRIRAELIRCMKHGRFPLNDFFRLTDDNGNFSNLFDVSINYYHTHMADKISDAIAKTTEIFSGEQFFPLHIIIRDWDGSEGIQVDYDYHIRVYVEKEIEILHHMMMTLIKECIDCPECKICALNLLDKKQEALIEKFNDSAQPIPQNTTILDLIKQQVLQCPNRIALSCENVFRTYQELEELSDQLARYLIYRGIRSNHVVGLWCSPSLEAVIAIYGILKAGASYLPLDGRYPYERLLYMIENASCNALLFLGNTVDIKFPGMVITYSQCFEKINGSFKLPIVKPSQSAYIIYTSGSSGVPKGVVVGHDNLINYICWAKRVYSITTDDVFPLYSSLSFDLTVTSLFTPLVSGAEVVIYNDNDDEPALFQIISKHQATIAKLTPTHLQLLKDHFEIGLPLSRIIVGGEILTRSLAEEIYIRTNKQITIWNEYGPTEATVGCMVYQYNPESDLSYSVPIGHPGANTRLYVLNKFMRPVPPGIPGELYIVGKCVTRGYINQKEMTSQAFVQINGKSEVAYRSGDIVRFLDSNYLEFLGRNDQQVKINGLRIELGEIRERLLRMDNIDDACILVKGEENRKYICAYVLTCSALEEKFVKSCLASFLPKYMIPTHVICMHDFPVTTNGKLDLTAFPDPIEMRLQARQSKESHLGDIRMQILFDSVKKILNISHINSYDNFFALGGDSISAVSLSAEVRKNRYILPVQSIMAHPVFVELYKFMSAEDSSFSSVKSISQDIVLSPIVKGFLNCSNINHQYYCQHFAFQLKESFSIAQIQVAFEKLVEFHDALRFGYDEKCCKLFCRTISEFECPRLKCTKVDCLNADEQVNFILKIIRADIGFNLKTNILIKCFLFILPNRKQVIVFKAHHLVIDSVSWKILYDDFLLLLNAQPINMKTASYQEYMAAKWMKQACKFNYDWQKRNCEKAVFEECSNLFSVDKKIWNLPQDLEEAPFLLFLTSFCFAFSTFSGRDSLSLVLETHGRNNDIEMDVSHTVGWFTDLISMTLELRNIDIVEEYQEIKYEYQKAQKRINGFDWFFRQICLDSLERTPVICFNYIGKLDNIFPFDSEEAARFFLGLQLSNNEKNDSFFADMECNCMAFEGKLCFWIRYNKNIFPHFSPSSFGVFFRDSLETLLSRSIELTGISKQEVMEIGLSEEEFHMLFDD